MLPTAICSGCPVNKTSAQPIRCLNGQFFLNLPISSGGSSWAAFRVAFWVTFCAAFACGEVACGHMGTVNNKNKNRILRTDLSLFAFLRPGLGPTGFFAGGFGLVFFCCPF